MNLMATPKKKPTDRHKHKIFPLRLPAVYGQVMKEVCKHTRRNQTEECKIALEKHFKELGFWPPADSKETGA